MSSVPGKRAAARSKPAVPEFQPVPELPELPELPEPSEPSELPEPAELFPAAPAAAAVALPGPPVVPEVASAPPGSPGAAAVLDEVAGKPAQGSQEGTDPPPGPPLLAAGTYAVYDDGQGGLVMVGQTADGATHRKHLTARTLRIMAPIMGRFFGSPVGKLLGGDG